MNSRTLVMRMISPTSRRVASPSGALLLQTGLDEVVAHSP